MQEPDISKLFKTPTYLLVAGSVFGMGAVIFFGQPILTKQLNDWQLLPRPERVTEFFFTDFNPALASANTDRLRTVAFTVRNLEHQTTDYSYTLLAAPADGGVEQQVGSGSFALDHDRSKKISERITIPAAKGRVMVKAKLTYEGIALGDLVSSTQTQFLHYSTESAAQDGDES